MVVKDECSALRSSGAEHCGNLIIYPLMRRKLRGSIADLKMCCSYEEFYTSSSRRDLDSFDAALIVEQAPHILGMPLPQLDDLTILWVSCGYLVGIWWVSGGYLVGPLQKTCELFAVIRSKTP